MGQVWHGISTALHTKQSLHNAVLGLAGLIKISVNWLIYNEKTIIDMKIQKPVTFCLFVLLLYVPSQQLWSWRDGQFT